MLLEEYLYHRLAEGLLRFEHRRPHEIYVVSMYIDFDDGPHRLKVWLYYNTLSNLHRVIEDGEDPAEARWNFALWEQDFIAAVGLRPDECQHLADGEWTERMEQWLIRRGLFRTADEIDAMLREEPEGYADWDQQVRSDLLDLLVKVARRLQQSGVLLLALGRSVPLLVHEWEYNPWTLEATRWANPEGLVAEFATWLMEGGRCD